MRGRALLSVWLVGCSTHTPPTPSQHVAAEPHEVLPRVDAGYSSAAFVLKGGDVFGIGKQNLLVDAGHVIAVGVAANAAQRVVDVSGRYIVPGFIDSHVHLAYDPEGDELLSNGVVAVLDLGAPLRALSAQHSPLQVLNSGPMITAEGGYPVSSWGKDGYGLEVATPKAAAAAVETLLAAGAQVIKVPLTTPPTLDDAAVRAVVGAAHAHGLKVFTHALDEKNAARAAADGVDVLAHTPTEALSNATLDAWSGRTVISSLAAFGGAAATLKNLHDLRERGARVLYGTDFGNTRDARIQEQELNLLVSAGLDGPSIVKAGTSAPAEFLGLSELGSLAVGKRASFLVLAADPSVDPHTLSQPVAVYVEGKLLSAGM